MGGGLWVVGSGWWLTGIFFPIFYFPSPQDIIAQQVSKDFLNLLNYCPSFAVN